MNQRGSIIPVIAFLFGAAVVVTIFGYMLWPKESEISSNTSIDMNKVAAAKNANGNVNSNANANTNSTTDPAAGWKTYTNATHGYNIKYPKDYVPSGTTEKYKFQKGQLSGDTTHSVTVQVLTQANLSRFPEEEQGWYTWAINGFSSADKTHANKRTKKLGDNTFTVTDFDPASGVGLLVDYYSINSGTVYILRDFRVGEHNVTTNETITSTFTFTK